MIRFNFKLSFRSHIFFNLFLVVFLPIFGSFALDFPQFDRGPDAEDPAQVELAEILNELPHLPGISTQLQVLTPQSNRGQKMRPDFGAMPIRGFLVPNSVSVLVIGQDATHIAEGANRPGIAGFGGRVHDMLRHFGIIEGVIFTNLFVSTISGQYGSRNTPVVVKNSSISYENVIENRLWMLAHEGPYSEWRNKFLAWIIRNNSQSLRMVLLLGQAGKDAGANFINYIGGQVGPRASLGDGSQYQVPWFEMVRAGGNNEWAVPVTEDGKDIAEELRKIPSSRNAVENILTARISENTQNIEKLNSEILELENLVKKERLEQRKRKKIHLSLPEDERDETQFAIDQNKSKKAIAAARKKKALTAKRIETYQKTEKILNLRLMALGKPLNYSDGSEEYGLSTENAKDLLTLNQKQAIDMMVFTQGGPQKNGVLYPQQFGGWDLGTMKVNGVETRSIAGLKIPCLGSKVGECKDQNSVPAPDVVFVGAPHPTALSSGEVSKPGSASQKVEKELLAPLRKEMKRGWVPPQPEPPLTSAFIQGDIPYQYGRGFIPESHGDPGITPLRLLPVSTAKRERGNIVIGTRDRAKFNTQALKSMKAELPADRSLLESHLVLTGKNRISKHLFKFDRGPDDTYSKLLFNSLDPEIVFAPKSEYTEEYLQSKELEEGKLKKRLRVDQLNAEQVSDARSAALAHIFDQYGMDGFDYKSHPDAGFFGHYRGTFNKPKVIILADPVGYDSFLTSKAATGDRGQYLHGLMEDLGIGKDYLVISTVPLGMDNATPEEWEVMLKRTESYRDELFAQLKKLRPKLFIADGNAASSELKRILGARKFVTLKQGTKPSQGIKRSEKALRSRLKLGSTFNGLSGQRADIPREHLTWIARVWEGTSGDRVITAEPTDKANFGKAFAIVAPKWAISNIVYFGRKTREQIESLTTKLVEAGEPQPRESLSDFVTRRTQCSSIAERDDAAASDKEPCSLPFPVDFGDETDDFR